MVSQLPTTESRPSLLRKTLKFLAFLAAGLSALLCTLALVLRFVLIPNLGVLAPKLTALAGQAIGARVEASDLSGGWHGLEPVVRVGSLRLVKGGKTTFSAASARAQLSWVSLLTGRPVFSSLQITGPQLSLERLSGDQLLVAGFPVSTSPSSPGAMQWLSQLFDKGGSTDFQSLLKLVLLQGEVSVANGTILVQAGSQEPLAIEGLKLDFKSGFHAWQASATARLVRRARAVPILAALQISQNPLNAPTDWRSWQGTARISTGSLDLTELAEAAGFPGLILRGKGAIEAQARFDKDAHGSLHAAISVPDLALQLAAGQPPFAVSRLRSEADLRIDGDTLAADFPLLQFATNTSIFRNTSKITLRMPTARPLFDAGHLSIDKVSLSHLADILPSLPLPDSIRSGIARHDPRGYLQNIDLQWDASQPAAGVALACDFKALAIRSVPSGEKAIPGIPGFTGLDGHIQANAAGGSATVTSLGGSVLLPGVFRNEETLLGDFSADLSWTVKPRLRVQAKNVRLSNGDAQASCSLVWTDNGGLGHIDLEGQGTYGRARSAWRYVPEIATDDTIDWLQGALKAGYADNARVILRGNLEDFPWKGNKDGQFLVTADLHDVQLDYLHSEHAGCGKLACWPEISGISGRLRFEAEKMLIEADSGHWNRASVTGAKATIADLSSSSPELLVDGRCTAPLQDYIAFVERVPLDRDMSLITGAKALGQASMHLNLLVGLADLAKTRFSSTLTLSDNRIQFPGRIPLVQHARGDVQIASEGVWASSIAATVLSVPLSGSFDAKNPNEILIKATGTASASELSAAAGLPAEISRRLEGSMPLSAQVRIARGAPSVTVSADAARLESQLPAPLARTAGQALGLKVQWTSSADFRSQTVLADAGDWLHARAALNKAQVTQLAIGVNRADAPSGPGLNLAIRCPTIEASQWQQLADAVSQKSGKQPGAATMLGKLPLHSASLEIGNLHYRNRQYTAIAASLQPDQAGGWNIAIHSDQIVGQANWTPQSSRASHTMGGLLRGQFSRIALPQSSSDSIESLMSRSYDVDLPDLDISVKALQFGKKRLGATRIVAENEHGGWRIKQLSCQSDGGQLAVTGFWQAIRGQHPKVSLQGSLKVDDAGHLAAAMGLPNALQLGSGTIEGQMGWRGSIMEPDWPTCSGQLSLDIRDGRILQIEPGVGRLLSLLSLQSLLRRVKLDFRDVFSKGFEYQRVHAKARIANGVLSTNNFRLSGNVASVLIEGSTDLERETQNLHILVLPDVTSGGASLLAAIANPVIGIGSLVAQMVLKKPLSHLFSYEYNVTGTWDEPVLKPVQRVQAAEPSQSNE